MPAVTRHAHEPLGVEQGASSWWWSNVWAPHRS